MNRFYQKLLVEYYLKLKNLVDKKSTSEGKRLRSLAAVDKVHGQFSSLFLFPRLFTILSATLAAEIALFPTLLR